jgi:hypothetical protein
LVHIGQAYLRNEADAWQMAETMYNYPTLSDLFRHAALKAIAAHGRRQECDQAVPTAGRLPESPDPDR